MGSEPGTDQKELAPLWVVFLVVFVIAGCLGPALFIPLMVFLFRD